MGDFTVKGIYASGMVLQRNVTNCIFGSCDAGIRITMQFREKTYTADTDSRGEWKIEYNPGEAGGPFLMTVDDGISQIAFSDVYVGEVWVSSGQSNAQLPMERLKFSYPDEFALPENPNIRMITIPIAWSFDGEKDSLPERLIESEADGGTKAQLSEPGAHWKCASPENLGEMSGTGYFFARRLAAELGVPVGIINASQGGSPVSAWLSRETLAELGKTDYLARCDFYRNLDTVAQKQAENAKAQDAWNTLIYNADALAKSDEVKKAVGELDGSWTDVTIPGELTEFSGAGIVWLKKEITLTAEQVRHFEAQKTFLWLGTIIDADTVFVNNVLVGRTYYSYPPRRYEVPHGILREGKNTITVRVQKNSAAGHIRFFTEKPYFLFTQNVRVAPCASRNIEVFDETKELPPDAEKISLSGIWKAKSSCTVQDAPPNLFFEWEPTALYNSMLAPCFRHAVAGALWYQGESDAGRYDEYEELLTALMALWRKKFIYAPKNMPFVVVQLPNWSDGNDENPAAAFSDWAELRETQANAVKNTENAALAVAIDAGEWNDLHPEKKRTVGSRAAEQALRIAYKKDFPPAPEFSALRRNGSAATVTFTAQISAQAKPGTAVAGFSALLQDGTAATCHAIVSGETTVEVTLPQDATELRYLWAQSPAPVQLYSAEQLPAAPFRTRL